MEKHGNIAVHSQTKKQEESTLHYIFKGSAVKRQQQKSLRNPFLPGKNEHYQINYQDILSICFISIALEEGSSLRKEKQYELRSEVQEYPWAQHQSDKEGLKRATADAAYKNVRLSPCFGSRIELFISSQLHNVHKSSVTKHQR